MTGAEWSDFLATGFLYASTVATFVLILSYGTLARWEKTTMGRHLMVFSVAMFLVLLQRSLGVHENDYPGHLFLRPATYIMVFSVWVWRLSIFFRDYREAKKQLPQDQLVDTNTSGGST